MRIERLTGTELAILEALATYRFLTADQMMRLGVTKAKRHLYVTLRTLKQRKPALLIELDFGVLPTKGRLSRIYTLTKDGAELVAEAHRSDTVVAVSATVRAFPNDYFHRIRSIDFHIALLAWAARTGAHVDFFKSYYDPWQEVGGKRAPKTRIRLRRGHVDPDALFTFTPRDGDPRLCAFEMCRGRRTSYVEKKLDTYLQALDEEAIEKACNYAHGVRVLLVFDNQDTTSLELVGKRVMEQPRFTEFMPAFFTKTIDEVEHDFVNGWRHLDGEVVPLFETSRETAVA